MKVGLHDLPSMSDTRGDELEIVGGGVLEQAQIRGLRWRSVVFRPGIRRVRLLRCSITDCHVENLFLYGVTLERCTVKGVKFPWVADCAGMVSCKVEGLWGGPLSAKHGPVVENDFSGARGIVFVDGVELSRNTFAQDGSQLIVSRDHPAWQQVVQRAQRDAVADSLVKELSGRQSWAVFYRSETDPRDWDFYTALFGEAGVRMSPDRDQLLPSFGPGTVWFFSAANDSAAKSRALGRPGTMENVELTPSGITTLGRALGLGGRPLWQLVADDERIMLVSIDDDLAARIAAVSEDAVEEVLRNWDRENEALEEFGWAEDPRRLLAAVVAAARSRCGQRLYAAFLRDSDP